MSVSIIPIIMRSYFIKKKKKRRKTREYGKWSSIYLWFVLADCSKVHENRVLGGRGGGRGKRI